MQKDYLTLTRQSVCVIIYYSMQKSKCICIIIRGSRIT